MLFVSNCIYLVLRSLCILNIIWITCCTTQAGGESVVAHCNYNFTKATFYLKMLWCKCVQTLNCNRSRVYKLLKSYGQGEVGYQKRLWHFRLQKVLWSHTKAIFEISEDMSWRVSATYWIHLWVKLTCTYWIVNFSSHRGPPWITEHDNSPNKYFHIHFPPLVSHVIH